MHPIKPDATVQKVLISTTSRLVGEFISEDLVIAHSWQSFGSSSSAIRSEENPASRSAFVVAFKTKSLEKKAAESTTDYTPTGEIICSYLSVLYGKRFDCHGLIEGGGLYRTPDLSAFSMICDHRLPINSHKPRNCFKTPLNLSAFSNMSKLWSCLEFATEFQTKLNAACKFYMQALQNAEKEPEVAYLHLITSGEILASFFKYQSDELITLELTDILNVIENELENGEIISKKLSERLKSIKRSFVKALCSLVDEDFFESSETKIEFGHFQHCHIERNIAAAYDLRSKYVHTGVPFGKWVQPNFHLNDLQFGTPVVSDKRFSKILEKAPTFLGLERFIRYCLLRFIGSNGFSDILKYRNPS